jgi:8-oxo-dGTP pyrophosphatase MutT (NUDIX family)
MAIRSAAKAIIVHEGKVLLNKCTGPDGIYFDLPGGGQRQFETLEEAVIRECLEETGRLVKIIRFAALCEEIYDDQELREKYFDYTHRVHHVFLAELANDAILKPTETDFGQDDNQWVSISDIPFIDLRPRLIHKHFREILASSFPLYLGSIHEGSN